MGHFKKGKVFSLNKIIARFVDWKQKPRKFIMEKKAFDSRTNH